VANIRAKEIRIKKKKRIPIQAKGKSLRKMSYRIYEHDESRFLLYMFISR